MTITVTHDGTSIPLAPSKDPDSIIDYGFDWTDFLSVGETISTSTWILDSGLTESSNSFTDSQTAIFISGGIVGTVYTITNRITTNSAPPRTEDRSMYIRVKSK